MPPTLQQIARMAGVSPMTVSRVLRGLSRVSPETRAKVRATAEKLGLGPNGAVLGAAVGQTIAEHRMRLLAVEGEQDSTDSERIFSAFRERVVNEGGSVVSLPASSVRELRSGTEQAKYHGCVWLGKVDPVALKFVRKRWPCVLAGGSSVGEAIDSISMNENRAAVAILDHLRDLGHTQIVWLGLERRTALSSITTPGDLLRVVDSPGSARHAAWLYLAKYQAGHPVAPMHLIAPPLPGKDWVPHLEKCADWLVRSRPAPTALIIESDELAFRLLPHLASRGLAVPHGISIVSYGNAAMARRGDPPLTTINPPWEQIGRTLPEMIRRRLIQPSAPVISIELEAALIVRDSTWRAKTSRRRPLRILRDG